MDAPLPKYPVALSLAENAELEELLRRQTDGWSRSQPTSIEELINEQFKGSSPISELASVQSQDWLLALISNEVALREHAGERPSLAEYQRRFPNISEALSIQWQFDRLLEDRGRSTVPSAQTPPAAVDGPRTRIPMPRRIGHYEILAELGRGATGVVYKAWDPQLKRLLAIKRLREGIDADPAALARMFSEAEAIARIDHLNIVKIFEVTEADGLPALAMEVSSAVGNRAKTNVREWRCRRAAAPKTRQIASKRRKFRFRRRFRTIFVGLSRTRSLEAQDIMGRTCSSSLNRRMRTRMSGGVRRLSGDGQPYPISADYLAFSWDRIQSGSRLKSRIAVTITRSESIR